MEGTVATIVPAHWLTQPCSCTHCATWIPSTFFNISTFLSTFFPPSADNKDRTHWWIWFSGDCRAAHAFKALLQPAQARSHHACSRTWCLPGWCLPLLALLAILPFHRRLPAPAPPCMTYPQRHTASASPAAPLMRHHQVLCCPPPRIPLSTLNLPTQPHQTTTHA